MKACHAVFYETLLSSPLRQLAVVHVVLSGQVNEQRVLHSALEAHLRPLDVNVSKDAVASIQPQLASVALERVERDMGARITTAKVISFTGGRAQRERCHRRDPRGGRYRAGADPSVSASASAPRRSRAGRGSTP
ncbi:isochorismatase family protein [Streptomyces sp. NPDC058255]|uniref:isochorismatase family protein n=1 Tax=Streptomyces sp. NPDC058255 TaxID=3346407 RepID=UPI0036EAA45E